MKYISIFIFISCTLLLLGGCSSGRYLSPASHFIENTGVVNNNLEKAFSLVKSSLTANGFKITESSLDNGIIVAAGEERKMSGLDCGELVGRTTMSPVAYNLIVTFSKRSEQSTQINIDLTGNATAYRHRKFLFIAMGHTKVPTQCRSTGILEKKITSAANRQIVKD